MVHQLQIEDLHYSNSRRLTTITNAYSYIYVYMGILVQTPLWIPVSS